MRNSKPARGVTLAMPLVALCLMLLAGCMHDDNRRRLAPGSAPNQPAHATTPISGAPLRLNAGDQLRITVYGEDRISGTVTVESDGDITLPLAGQLNVAGLTPQEAGQRIAARLNGQLVQPRVSVTVLAWRPIYISGEVERAGQYAWQPGLNLMSALALAGGATRRASRDEILVQRGSRGALVTMPLSPETPVYPGDLIKAPERFF